MRLPVASRTGGEQKCTLASKMVSAKYRSSTHAICFATSDNFLPSIDPTAYRAMARTIAAEAGAPHA